MARRRSTSAEIIDRERKAAEVVAELMLLGAYEVAASVLRCWHNRLFADPRQHRPRCRSVCCLSCRRPSLAAWWRSFVAWSLDRGATSYLSLPITDSFAATLSTIGQWYVDDQKGISAGVYAFLEHCS